MRKIIKRCEQRREELKQSLDRLSGALQRYKVGLTPSELGTIAIELRGLVCKEGLFITIAEEKEFPLNIYTIPLETINAMSERIPKPSLSWAGDSISINYDKPWVEKISIKNWLKTIIAEINGKKVTAEWLINEISKTSGPAHYSSDISKHLSTMMQFELGGMPSQFRTLVKFAEILRKLCMQFLAKH